MYKLLRFLFFLSGWILLFISLGTAYVFNTFDGKNTNTFTPIPWEDHVTVFNGALSCGLTSKELRERKAELKSKIFPFLKKKIALEDGFIYYFDDEKGLAENIMEFIAKEKQCCPFFQFDLSVLPFEKGLALKISGSKAVKEFLEDFEKEDK